MGTAMAKVSDAQLVHAQVCHAYDVYRTALLNRKYYAARLGLYRQLNRGLEIAVALGTTGTTWAVWQTPAGRTAWMVVSAVASVLALLKPVVQLSKSIERTSKLYLGHSDVYVDLWQLVNDIQTSRTWTAEMASRVRRAEERYKKLALEDDGSVNERLRQRCFDEVNREVPPDSLWAP